MAKAKYTITKDDKSIAYAWIEKKLNEYDFPSKKTKNEAEELFVKNARKSTAKNLNEWCEKYLSKEQWKKLKGSIRAQRKRMSTAPSKKKISIDLDQDAYNMLSEIAVSESVTLSQVIRTHLKKPYLKALKSDKKLQEELTL